MGKKLETIMLDGVEFTIKSTTVEEPRYNTTPWNKLKLLHECYSKPSSRKISINRFWLQWMYNVNYFDIPNYDVAIIEFGIRSYNCNFFAYGGIITINGARYVIDITATHNYLWRIAE